MLRFMYNQNKNDNLEFGHLPATKSTPGGLLDTCQDVGLKTTINFGGNLYLQSLSVFLSLVSLLQQFFCKN